MLKQGVAACAVLALGGIVFAAAGAARTDDAANGTTRIGVYDSRAIAIAYAPSRFNPVKERMAEYEQAKAARDKAKMKQLEAWGQEHQRQLHFQGFGRAPVDDLLAPVADQVAKVGRDMKLAAITMDCDFVAEGVEIVDVTDALVQLYEPSEKTLKYVIEVRKIEPTPLVELSKLPAKE